MSATLFSAVDSILVAEFDIDRGSSLTHQYPIDTGVDPHVLAELMLPDGAHLRDEDWTMFLLNQKEAGQARETAGVVYEEFAKARPTSSVVASVSAYIYEGSQRGWVDVGRGQKVALHLEAGYCNIWTQLCPETFEIDLREAEYCRVAPLCLYLYGDLGVCALRFDNDDDEHYFVELIDACGAVWNGRAERPPQPPPLNEMERPLLYVLNLVRTKHISTVRRGARVKAMAIASRYQWVHVFKPLLILALEKFFEDPGVSILEDLFYSLNSLDISRIPRLSMSEKKIFRGTEDHKILDDKLLEDEQKAAAASALRDTKDGRASDLTAINVEAASIQSEATHKPTNKDRQFFETAVQYSGIRVPLRIPLVMYREEFGDPSLATLLMRFGTATIYPPASGPGKEPNSKEHWKAGIQYSWHPDIDYGAQTHPIMLIMNAILAGKRVLFLGDKKPSGEVANYVLAACALVGGGGVITGLTQRCYPYVSLAGLDTLLATQDYIAGVTNPVFEEQQTWWDVLCNVNTGKITVSPHLIASVGSRDNDYAGGSTKEREKEWNRSMRWEGENELALEALTLAQSHASEFTLRQKFFDYVLRFTEVASVYDRDHNGDRQSAISIQPQHVTYPEMGFGTYFASPAAKKKELGMLINRIGAWMRTRSFANYRREYAIHLKRRAITSIDMRHIVTFLRTGYDGYDPSVVKMFLTLQDVLCCATDGMITELLGLLPERQGGLFPIATGLFFWRWEVRRACVRLLRRIGSHKIGNRIIERLNPMVRMAYQRAHRDFYGDNLPPGLPVPITPLTLPQSLRSTSSRDTIGSRDGDTRQTIPMRASTPSLSSAYYSSNSVSQRPSIASMREFTQPEYNPQIQAASIARPGSALSSIPSPSTASQANSTFSSSQSQASPLGPAPPTPNNPSSPLNPVVQRMLQQQSRHQEHLKATLSALQIDPSSQVTDTINPEFGKDEQDSDASSSVTSPTAMLALDIIQPWPLPPDRTDSLASNSPGYDEDLNEGNPRRPPNEEYIPAEILLQRGAAKPALLVTASSPATEYTNNPHPVPQRHTSPFPRAPSSPIRSLGASLAPVSPTTLPTTITTGSGQERKRDSGQSGSPAVGSFSPTFGTGGFEGYETLMRFYATDEASVGAGTGSAGTARTEGSVVADDEGLPDDRRRTLYMGDQNEA